MSKTQALFSIGQLATVCDISIDTLRFYEKKALITPVYTNLESGYRYYNRENLFRLRSILRLKDAGLSLAEIRYYLESSNHGNEKKIEELKERRDLLNHSIEDLLVRSTKPEDLTVGETDLPDRLCLCRTFQVRDGSHALELIGEFYDQLIRQGITISRRWPEFCEYPDPKILMGEFQVKNFVITACMPVEKDDAPAEAVLYPSGKAVTINYRGEYYGLWKAYQALNHYIKSNGYQPSGYPQEIYLEISPDGGVGLEDADNITRVIIPIIKDKNL